jgi:hypothetical protein
LKGALGHVSGKLGSSPALLAEWPQEPIFF